MGSYHFIAAQVISEQYVPDIVKNKMQTMFPMAKGTYWKQLAPGFLDAYFTLDKKKYNATFQVTGAWVSTESEIEATELPDTIRHYLNTHTDKITRCFRIESKANGLQYAAEGKVKGQVITFLFHPDGSLLMQGPKR